MHRPTRRGFIAAAGALMGAAALDPVAGMAESPVQGGWDLAWLDKLTGKHRQVFDMASLEIGLLVVKNWYEAHFNVYGLKHPDLNAVVGIGGHAFPFNASDDLYRKFPIGAEWKVTDPDTNQPALRNIFLDGPAGGPMAGGAVRPLQARGAIFWQCNNALMGVAARLAAVVKRPQPEVYQELRAGLNPGVILVPAHTMLIGLCQEHGCSYEMVS